MLSEDVSAVDFSVEALVLGAVAWETLDGVGDVEATIDGTLHGTEDASSRGGTGQTDVQVTTESSWAIVDWFDQVFLAGDIGTASVQSVQTKFLQDAAGNQQSRAVSSSVVGQTDLDAIAWQLVGVSGAHNTITLNAGVSDLAGDVTVAQTDNQTILRGVVLVLVLEDQTLTGIVVGLALTTPAEPDLVTLEVLLILNNLHETLLEETKTKPIRNCQHSILG